MFSNRYIESVISPGGHVLQSRREIGEAFQVHFCARLPDLPLQEIYGYLVDFLRLREAEAAVSEGLVRECEIHDALK